jgi:hypothetical protein
MTYRLLHAESTRGLASNFKNRAVIKHLERIKQARSGRWSFGKLSINAELSWISAASDFALASRGE